ncbi:MAG: hypothetical protein WCF17_09460 [Terracidiphilus sp.]
MRIRTNQVVVMTTVPVVSPLEIAETWMTPGLANDCTSAMHCPLNALRVPAAGEPGLSGS